MNTSNLFLQVKWFKALLCGSVTISSLALSVLFLRAPEVMANSACPDVSVNLNPVDVFPLPHARIGDKEMDGNYPTITIRATAARQGQSIVVNGKVHMQEGKSDWTTFEQNFVEETPVGALSDSRCEVVGMTPVQGNLSVNTGDDNHRWTVYSGRRGGLIQSAKCLADTKGGDKGKLGCKNIQFAPVTIQRRTVPQSEPSGGGRCTIWMRILGLC